MRVLFHKIYFSMDYCVFAETVCVTGALNSPLRLTTGLRLRSISSFPFRYFAGMLEISVFEQFSSKNSEHDANI